MVMRYKILVNPISGWGLGDRSIPQIESLFTHLGLEYDLARTEHPWHAVQLAQQAVLDGYNIVVAVGGDGTANEVLNGLMLSKGTSGKTCAMGILSVGRGNDFAFGVGIPKDLEKGCQALAQDHRRTIDVGRVIGGNYPDGRYFGNGVGIGFDAVVGFEAAKMVHIRGLLSYLIAAIKTIYLYYQAPSVRIEYDNQTIQLSTLMISVMNGRRMGGGFMMAPHGNPGDNLLDVCIATQVSRSRIFGLIPHFLRGTQSSQPEIKNLQARWLTVDAIQGSLPAHADGETICTDGQKLTIELLPSQIEMICQKTQEIK
jgi:diacylglycerol kinase (ATP)